jgi:hypothetical protein
MSLIHSISATIFFKDFVYTDTEILCYFTLQIQIVMKLTVNLSDVASQNDQNIGHATHVMKFK